MSSEKLNLQLNQTMIPIVSHTKFLGVTIDNKLKWSEHINNIISKISVNKNVIGRAQKSIKYTCTKKCIYYAHIHSHLTYTNTVWGNSVTFKQKKNIETIQKYCIRAIHNKPRNYPTDNLFKNL